MDSVGSRLLASVLVDGGAETFLNLGLKDDLFLGVEKDLFQFMEQHVIDNGVLPAKQTVQDETGDSLPKVVEPPSFYLRKVEDRYIHTTLKKGMLLAEDKLKFEDPEGAFNQLQALVTGLTLHVQRDNVVDFKTESHDMVYNDWKQKWTQGDTFGIHSGWPSFDSMTGGLVGGDVVVIAGRPAAGKTYKMLYMAMHAWAQQKKTPMFVSMEMPPLALIHRLAAIHTSIPSKFFKSGELGPAYKKKAFNVLGALKDSDMPPFWIIDGNLTSSVKDIVLLARQLKPDAVYVDGAYMLQPDGRIPSKWERVANTVEGLKQRVAGDLKLPVVASYQFNRDQTKAKEGATGLQHLAGADAIGQIASVVLGMFDEETVETEKKRRIEILKGRSGEVGEFFINWVFEGPTMPYMNFSEVKKKDPQKLKY